MTPMLVKFARRVFEIILEKSPLLFPSGKLTNVQVSQFGSFYIIDQNNSACGGYKKHKSYIVMK